MNTDTETEKKAPAKATGRRYGSVAALMAGESIPADVRTKYNELAKETRIVDQLAVLRQQAGITQEDMGKLLGVTQGAVSKLEAGRDEDLSLAQISAYSKATGQRVALCFGKPMNHVEAVKAYALGIKHHLSSLAGLAHQDEELEKEISGFFGEAFFNLLSILAKCHGEMPQSKEFEVKFQRIDSMTESPRSVARKSRSIQAAVG